MKKYDKLTDEFIKGVHKTARLSHCLICNKPMSSSCKSHVVPQFVLKEISHKGMVSYGYVFDKRDVQGCEKTTGVKNAHVFRLVCRECDRRLFSDYEKPESILDFDLLSSGEQTKMLRQMALKAHLSHIQMKYNRLIMKEISTGGRVSELEKQSRFTPERIDLNDHIDSVFATESTSYTVLYNKLLDYNVNFATQTLIYYVYDMEGRKTYNIYDLRHDEKISPFYLMILPVKGKTRIVFYINSVNERASSLIKQFSTLSEEEKLKFLFVSLIVFDQDFYVNPLKAEKIIKHDKKIVKLYSCTDQWLYWPIDNRRKIKNFRRYNNYLIENWEELL